MKRSLSLSFLIVVFVMLFSSLTYAKSNSLSNSTKTISSGIPIQGKISSSSTTNTYKFSTNKDGEVYITLDETTGGFSMYLYDEDGNNLGGDYYSTRGSKIVINKNIQKGTYYIKISPYGWNGIQSATYRVKATYAAPIKRNLSSFEPNDTVETSLPVGSGQFYKSSSESNIDRDVYQFTTSKDGEVYITLDETTGGYSMYLYDVYGNNLGGDYYSTRGNKIVINKNVQQGTYYIKISPYGWSAISSATYRAKATYASTIKRDAATFEPNDTIETSMPIVSGKTYNSSGYSNIDRDVYQFTVGKDGNVDITLTNTTGGYSMYLYDINGNSLGGDYYSSRGNTIRINKDLQQGTYYIRVSPYGWDGITSASYSLKTTYPTDTTKPDNVKVTAKTVTQDSVTLQLSAQDASGIKEYGIYRDGKLIKKVSNVAMYKDTGLKSSTTYTYKIKAYDTFGNAAESPSIRVKTKQKDTTKPDNVKVTAKTVTQDSVTLQLSAHDASGIKEYGIYRDGKLIKKVSNVATYKDTGLKSSTTYTYKITAYDTFGNASESPSIRIKTKQKDTTKPDNVKVTAKSVTQNSVTLQLSAHNASGIKEYEIYRDGKLIKKVSNVATYLDTGLQSGTTYTYKIKAYDIFGNASESSSIRVTTKTGGQLSSGIPIQGKISSSDNTDTYKFSTNKDGEVYITLDETTGGFSMYLYDEDGNNLGGDYYSNRGNKIVIDKNLPKGTYYIKISPYGWNGIQSAAYRVKATYAAPIKRNPSSFEPNDTVETSLSVGSGQFYKSSSESNIDRDVYQFTTSKDGEVYITLDETTGGYSMYLYDVYGNNLGGDYYSTRGNKIVINKNVQKGTYYIKVLPYGWNGITKATYRLKATYASSIKRDAATFEPNDTIETSMPVVSGKTYNSSGYSNIDRDVYQFTTGKDGNVDITLTNTTGGYSMYLYDIDGNSLGGDYYSSRGNTIRINKDLQKGTYYIRVSPYGWDGITSATYQLKAIYMK